MPRNFFEERKGWKDALSKQEASLKEHRETLDVFKFAFEHLDEDTPDFIADGLQNAIRRETAKVESIENEIRGIQRILREKYSLAPAS